MSNLSVGDSHSSNHDFQYRKDQTREIIKGLQPGHRLAYDKLNQKFVSLPQKSKEDRYTQDLDLLVSKIVNFVSLGRKGGVTAQDAKEIQRAAFERAKSLGKRVTGFRGFLMPESVKKALNIQSAALERVGNSLQEWAFSYVDNYNLLSSNDEFSIQSSHQDWFLNQAILLEQIEKADPETRKQLELLIFHAFSKAARRSGSEELRGYQATPLSARKDYMYYRQTHNQFLELVSARYAKELQLPPEEVFLVHGQTLREVFSRQFLHPQKPPHTLKDFEAVIDDVLQRVGQGERFEKLFMIEITGLMKNENAIIEKLRGVVKRKLEDFKKKNPKISRALLNQIAQKIQLYEFAHFQGQDLLITPNLFNSEPHQRREEILEIMHDTGFFISPDEAKAAWLKLDSLNTILKRLGISSTKLAAEVKQIPRVADSFKTFLKQPVIEKFEALGEKTTIAYLKILPSATVRLLQGLADFNPDVVFQERQLGDLLQISYFRIMNAMNEAILRKDDVIAFTNQIELIHQEIQNTLAILEPYNETDFSQTVSENLVRADVVGPDFEPPHVHLQPSAMRCVSSVLGAVEAQKGTQQLNVAVLKDSYYESAKVLDQTDAYTVSKIDGDRFEKEGIGKAFDQVPQKPLDLLVCEFHHNVSVTRTEYHPEKITEQVKALFENGLVADKFTVLIDTTINLENSEDIRSFLEDPSIKKFILEGKLNVVLVRSGQKFDMLGMDNYFGGITVSVNNGTVFKEFNASMENPEDQLTGLSYQGMTHLERHAHAEMDAYRKATMENTQKFYRMMPQAATSAERTQNPMQISQVNDEKIVFLDVKFPSYPETAQAFLNALSGFILENRLPMSYRASFGFLSSNFINIPRGNDKIIRINPGLEDEATLEKYAEFFHKIQKIIDETPQDDWLLSEKIQSMSLKL